MHSSKRTMTSKAHMEPEKSSMRPELPEDVQGSLMDVGMRIRKSVSTGYKSKQTTFPAYNQPLYNGVAENIALRNTTFSFEPNGVKRSFEDAVPNYNWANPPPDFEEPEWLKPFDVVMEGTNERL
ncbi:ribonucleotide reductase inhibitor [Schizosaccharomyces cryophilus OY26]|uniref:Ribonucleotide reductase inhibitor n=1 Tax=Schizosaccharomyces cryophilus (strain OY26 / ATCC MYA-4695 / CBS 11777 / NBRC 106824 / NRRL Y48691) TaxID=653667 RepID=S9X7Q4_SCHCR|nr:ribonucleotide reductase inhibitor [Schizosaccharomyces cryophilus OY26]EPY53147.1 ribonucleotide reductase inhibitor [Schizosaccharomyces cryophilus OY26]